MKIRICSPLRSYTAEKSTVAGSGATLREVLADLEARHPGIRFRMIDEHDRIREHIRIFVGPNMAEGLDVPVPVGVDLEIVAALSGG